MKKLASIIFSIALIAGCGDKLQDGDEVVVSYKGGVLTKHDLLAHHTLLKRDPRSKRNPELLEPDQLLEHAINMEMIIQAGLKRKIHQDPYVRQKLHEHMSQLFLKLLQKELVAEINPQDYTDEQIETFYKENLNLYKNPALYSVSLIKTSATEAEGIYQKITSGEIDFEAAVATYSTDEKSKANNGRIGKRSLNKFQPSWRDVISNLKQGKVTQPVDIKGEKYIFLLIDKTEEQQKQLVDIKDKVKNDLLYNDYRKEWEKTYNNLHQEFNVEIDAQGKKMFLQDMAKQ